MNQRLSHLIYLFESYSQELSKELEEELIHYLAQDDVESSFKTKIIMFLRKHKHSVNLEKLSKALNTSTLISREILNGKIIKAYFPIAKNKKAKLSSLYVIKIKNSEAISLKKDPKGLLKAILNLTKQGFFVTFEEEFSGDSFMLALISAIIIGNPSILNDFSFTGAVDSIGNILPAENLTTKITISQKHSKTLVHGGIISNLKELEVFLNSEKVDIPFCITLKETMNAISPKESINRNLKEIKEEIEKAHDIRVEAIKNLYGLKDEDLIFYTNEAYLPTGNWKKHILKAYSKIRLIKSKVRNKIPVVHIAILGPSSFAFSLGALMGCKNPFVFYHRQNNKYHKVFDYRDRNLRDLKEIKKETNLIRCTEEIPENTRVLGMIFYFASHNPIGEAIKYLSQHFNSYGTIKCSMRKRQGNTRIGDWTDYVREMYTIYNKTKNLQISKRVFFLSCPVAIAFCLGITIETSENADIMNFGDNNSYYKVFNLRDGIQIQLTKTH